METATQTKGRELRTEWDSTKKMQHFSSMSFASAPSISSGNIFSEETFQASGSSSVFLRSNSNNSSSTPLSDPKHSWNNINVSEFWRIDPAITGLEDSALVAGQTGKNSFISTCSQGFSQNQVAPSEPGEEAVSAVSCTSSWQEVQVQASDPEIVPLVCDPQVNLEQRLQSSCAGINSQEYNSTANHNFSSFLNSITDSHKRHEDFPFTGLKSTQGRGEYSAELQAYLGHANININLGSYIPPTTSTAMLNPASLEQFNQGFGRNSVDMFSGEIHAVEPNTSNSSVTASTTLAMSDMHMRCLKTMPSMRTFDVVGSHFYTVSDPQGVGADAFDHAQRIRARDSIFSLGVQENGIDPGTVVIPETKSAVSAGKMDFKDNSVIIPADCSVKQLQQKSLERTINPYKRICTDVGKNNLPTKKKSALWTSNVNSNGALQNSSMVTACKSSIASKTAMGPALNTNLRQRTKQGSASDPQSIAARHRRERISERLKILQDLVPNGSKVDLVTMLEKAINYVKFLQLQVKVLTTDEYWPMQDTAPKIMKVEDALQAIASAEAAEGIYTSGITNMDCTRTQTDQNPQNS